MMRHYYWVLLLVSFATCIISCKTTVPLLPVAKKVPELGSRVELAAGNVWLTGKEGKARLITGAMLQKQAEVSLDKGARALIRLSNGTDIFLNEQTKVRLDNHSVKLIQGELWADVPADERDLSSFNAGEVVVTASGAGFDIKKEAETVKVYVARGLAVVDGTGGRAEVQSGEIAAISPKQPPKVTPMGFWEDWTGGMADRELLAGFGGKASGRIYGIDRANPGSAPKELQILSQNVRTVIREGVAHTTVDQRFFNPAGQDVEGWYWFTVPEGASVERFALEVNGVLMDGEMTERNQAASAYEEAVQKAFDPALLEWVDGRTFRARIFPIPKAGQRRVVLSYTQFLPFVDGAYRYVYPMGGSGEKVIQEFSLVVDLGDEGENFEISTLQNARVEEETFTVSMRRSGFLPRSDFMLELKPIEKGEALRTYRYASGYNEAEYILLRYSPQIDFKSLGDTQGNVVIVFDTSAGGGAVERQIRTDVAEAILSALSDTDNFALVTNDLSAKTVFPTGNGLAKATEENVSAAMEKLSEMSSAGATDLGEMFNLALKKVHGTAQPAVLYVGDGRPTVGEIKSMALANRLRRSLGNSPARLFTIGVGADANHPLLERLSRVGGGKPYRVDTPEQTVQEALRFVGQLKTPTITDLVVDAGAGLDQVYATAAGKVTQGEELVLLARSHHELPKEIKISGNLAGKKFEQTFKTDVQTGDEYGYVPSLWARMYLERLMSEGQAENRGNIISLGLTYALMTPFTSFLVLDSDQAYAAAGIKRRQRNNLWGGFDSAKTKDAFLKTGQEGRFSDSRSKPEAMDVMEVMEEESSAAWGDGDMVSDAEPMPSPSANKISVQKKERRASGSSSGGGIKKRKQSAAKKRPKAKPVIDRIVDIGSSSFSQKRHQFTKGVCSDASRRPLSQRRILWLQKLYRMNTPNQYATLFFDAGSSCEIPRWRDKKILLALIEKRVSNPTDIGNLLYEFNGYTKYQKYLRRRILKRTLDPQMAFNLYQQGAVNWYSVKMGLASLKTPNERLEKLQTILKSHPDEVAGRALLIEVLLEVGKDDEALAVATRLRRDELAGPLVLATLCDLQSEIGQNEAAKRTCSELVEFNPQSTVARGKLGDLFLAHGWYDAAYRQYKTLVEMEADSPMAQLKLALAAAGMGKVDEALRIERKVAGGDGEIGPNDPRRFARLHSAVKLAQMMIEMQRNKSDDSQLKGLIRALKRTQNFTSPTTMMVLVWEDFASSLTMTVTQGEKPEVSYRVSDSVVSPQTGLMMVDLGVNPPGDLDIAVKINGTPVRKAIGFKVISIVYDGNNFSVSQSDGTLAPKAESVAVSFK